MAMAEQRQAGCTSWAALCYWGCVSLAAWAILGLVAIFWAPLGASPVAVIFFAVGIGCVANWIRNRTLHCLITAPLFLTLGALFLLSNLRIAAVDSRLLWCVAFIGTAAAFFFEWRCARAERHL